MDRATVAATQATQATMDVCGGKTIERELDSSSMAACEPAMAALGSPASLAALSMRTEQHEVTGSGGNEVGTWWNTSATGSLLLARLVSC